MSSQIHTGFLYPYLFSYIPSPTTATTTKSQSNTPTATITTLSETVMVGTESNDVPEAYGLLIRLEADGRVIAETVPDYNFQNVHNHCFAPASLKDEKILKGGGSGTTVFSGYIEELQEEVVMKHGNHRDTAEVFALVEIHQGLHNRGIEHPEAALDMIKRIPAFRMIYISPHHLRNRAKENWNTLRKVVSRLHRTSLVRAMMLSATNKGGAAADKESSSSSQKETNKKQTREMNRERLRKIIQHDKSVNRGIAFSLRDECLDKRRLCIERRQPDPNNDEDEHSANKHEFMEVSDSSVILTLPGLRPDGTIPSGTEFLLKAADELEHKQAVNNWKVTLGQKRIGGPDSRNGATILVAHELNGALLHMLTDEFTRVMTNLQNLTLDSEKQIIDQVKDELHDLNETRDVKRVSKVTDSFVGSAIIKNFHPEKGRFLKLRQFGEALRNESLHLEPKEILPCAILSEMLKPGVDLSEIFVSPPGMQSPFNFLLDSYMEEQWLELVELATSIDEKSAVERVWTAGLTDAGLHNAFLSPTRGLEVFDLGEPKLATLPAFLTKFLMSFWHCWGMEETNDDAPTWVNRFVVEDDQVALTKESQDALPYIHSVYQNVVNHFTTKVFNGEERIKKLLASYVMLQLVSDAAFCIERWVEKGGGEEKQGTPQVQHKFMDKWLWRSMWDLYVAFEVREKYVLSVVPN